jgi:hypothetical protein
VAAEGGRSYADDPQGGFLIALCAWFIIAKRAAGPSAAHRREGTVMRLPLLSTFALALATFLLAATPTLGAKPVGSCPAEASGYVLVDRDAWWDRTVLGFENEGIPVYDNGDFTEEFDAFAAELGFGDGAGLEFFVRVTQWDAFDLNVDGFVCMKDRPNTPGNPDYFLGGVDNTSSARKG